MSTYGGVLSAKPSKAVTLSGVLRDDSGRALAGQPVVFTLGSQSCGASTNASGIASCTIAKLTQKPGSYPLAMSYAGNASYVASSQTLSFAIG